MTCRLLRCIWHVCSQCLSSCCAGVAEAMCQGSTHSTCRQAQQAGALNAACRSKELSRHVRKHWHDVELHKLYVRHEQESGSCRHSQLLQAGPAHRGSKRCLGSFASNSCRQCPLCRHCDSRWVQHTGIRQVDQAPLPLHATWWPAAAAQSSFQTLSTLHSPQPKSHIGFAHAGEGCLVRAGPSF